MEVRDTRIRGWKSWFAVIGCGMVAFVLGFIAAIIFGLVWLWEWMIINKNK